MYDLSATVNLHFGFHELLKAFIKCIFECAVLKKVQKFVSEYGHIPLYTHQLPRNCIINMLIKMFLRSMKFVEKNKKKKQHFERCWQQMKKG